MYVNEKVLSFTEGCLLLYRLLKRWGRDVMFTLTLLKEDMYLYLFDRSTFDI